MNRWRKTRTVKDKEKGKGDIQYMKESEDMQRAKRGADKSFNSDASGIGKSILHHAGKLLHYQYWVHTMYMLHLLLDKHYKP